MNEEFKIVKAIYQDVKDIYPELYTEIFGTIDAKQIPSFIYMGWYKDKYVGFMSAYLKDLDTLYLQYAGFNDEFKGYMAVFLFKKVIEYVHREYKNIIFRIENTNIKALKVAMNTGFIIIGVRGDGIIENNIFKGKFYVELVKNRGG